VSSCLLSSSIKSAEDEANLPAPPVANLPVIVFLKYYIFIVV
jgi:hypothetical protein